MAKRAEPSNYKFSSYKVLATALPQSAFGMQSLGAMCEKTTNLDFVENFLVA